MKKIILTSFCVLSLLISKAQVVIDTVSIGAGYANQKWYSLQNDEQGSAAKNNWDIAFDCSPMGSTIHINSIIGTQLWKYPTADTSAWLTLDTTGIANWTKYYNSDTSWAIGAFDKGIVVANQYDIGWGIYSPITHIVTGDSLYVIKLAGGAYKKMWVENLSGGVYTFKYADINGANLQSASLSKSTYTGKNFGYYSLQTNAAVDREPVSTNWDLVFTQYTAFIPSAYTVSGILTNTGVEIAELNPIANPGSYTNWFPETYKTVINEIGYNWKAFNGATYDITDSLLYFVKTNAGDVWKIIPTGFGGGSNGNYMFSKEKLSAVGIKNESGATDALLSIYPNPSNTSNVAVIYNFENNVSSAMLNVYDLLGKISYSEKLNTDKGLHTLNLNTTTLTKGMYFVSIEVDGKTLQQKLIIE